MEINKRERDELLARWQRGYSDSVRSAALNEAVAELIEEACKGVTAGRIAPERCAAAGEAFGRAWHGHDLDPVDLVDQLCSVRRSVWDTVVTRFRSEGAPADSLVDARLVIDVAFDDALRRALAAFLREASRSGESGAEARTALDGDAEPLRSDFHAALQAALVSATSRCAPVGLVVLHIDVPTDGTDVRGLGADLLDVSEILALQLRHRDLAYRLTDSDHAIICIDTHAEGVRHLLDRISCAVSLYARRAGVEVDVTGGHAVAPDDGITSMDLIRVALADREFSLPGGVDASRV